MKRKKVFTVSSLCESCKKWDNLEGSSWGRWRAGRFGHCVEGACQPEGYKVGGGERLARKTHTPGGPWALSGETRRKRMSEKTEGEGAGAFLVTGNGDTQEKKQDSGHRKARPNGGGGGEGRA